MKTSNSSRHRKGDSIASHRAMINETVENDRSPPDNERVSLATRLVPCSTFTYKIRKMFSILKPNVEQILYLNPFFYHEACKSG